MEENKTRRHKKRKNNVVKYRRPFNIGLLFFGVIFIYMMICIYMYFTTVHISGYEVTKGSLAANRQFTGVAIRQEEIFQSDTAGYVSYYANAGSKVSVSTLVCTVDENRKVSDYIKENSEDINLTKSDYSALRSDISTFAENYSSKNFGDTYEFHVTTNGIVMELLNKTLLDSLEEAGDIQGGSYERTYGARSGIVEYYIDGMESLNTDSLTEDMLNKDSYHKEIRKNEDLISPGDDIYKLVTDEKWSLVVPLSEEEVKSIAFEDTYENGEAISKERSVIQVKFKKDGSKVWANCALTQIGEKTCLKLDFSSAMIRFASDRYLDISFLVDDKVGLKIPNSAITTKEFYTIPENYLTKGGEDGNDGFLVETFDKDGNPTTIFVSPSIYAKKDGFVYVNPNEIVFSTSENLINKGDVLIMPNSDERFSVNQTAALDGVYNINKGYTQFRRIQVIASNEEYSILEEKTDFGLVIYDQIVLDAKAVKEEQVVY